MRFIYGHADTLKLLQKWSAGKTVLIAKYFFWNSGSKEQRSQTGLFRCLLFESLSQRRNLIRDVFPEQWARYRSLGSQFDNEKLLWSLPVLKTAFMRLAQKASESLRMCFFVDGLDECEGTQESGDHRAMGEFLKTVSTSSFVKTCLSSRPWHQFEDIFSNDPRLRLQDLTRHDMRIYITDNLTENGRMKTLEVLGSDSETKLVNEILDKAEGVFLWVAVVLKSVVNGIGRYENITDLINRLCRLPSDVFQLYSHMFSRIESSDMQKAAQIIQIYHAKMGSPLRVIHLGLALEAKYGQAIAKDWEAMSTKDLILLYKRTAATLKSTCLGFFEIYEYHDPSDPEYALEYTNDEPLRQCHKSLLNNYFSYAHQTVKDFIRKEEMQEKLRLETRPLKGFCPLVSNAIASTLLCKVLKPDVFRTYVLDMEENPSTNSIPEQLSNILELWPRERDHKVDLQLNCLIDQLHDLIYNAVRYDRSSLSNADFIGGNLDDDAQWFEGRFFHAALLWEHKSWIIKRLKLIKRFPKIRQRPFLIEILNQKELLDVKDLEYQFGPGFSDNCDLIRFVLRCGGNPNDIYPGPQTQSFWGHFLKDYDSLFIEPYLLTSFFSADFTWNDYLKIMASFMVACLEAGANTDVEFEEADPSPHLVSVDSVIQRLEEQDVQGSKVLRQLFEDNRANKVRNTALEKYREPGPRGLKRAGLHGQEGKQQRVTARPRISYQ